LFLIASAAAVQAKDEGFSGKWVLDHHSPRPGDAPNKLETQIKQDGSGITIESKFQEPESNVVPLLYLGLMTSKLHLDAGGQQQQNQVGPFQMASTTTVDGNQMQTDWTATIQGDQVTGHWTHRLMPDGKHMVWEIQESTKGQRKEAKLYFVRK
jgi:hypothetical protein